VEGAPRLERLFSAGAGHIDTGRRKNAHQIGFLALIQWMPPFHWIVGLSLVSGQQLNRKPILFAVGSISCVPCGEEFTNAGGAW
jgi:hypothetical protein